MDRPRSELESDRRGAVAKPADRWFSWQGWHPPRKGVLWMSVGAPSEISQVLLGLILSQSKHKQAIEASAKAQECRRAMTFQFVAVRILCHSVQAVCSCYDEPTNPMTFPAPV